MKKLPNIEIAELFLVKTKWNKTFIGEAFRETKEDGKTIYYGEIVVNDGKISTMANTLSEVGTNLDGICTMILDLGIHNKNGVQKIIPNDIYPPFYLN